MKTSIRKDTKLWVFEQVPSAGERIYVFGYTWFEARGGALAALQLPSATVTGHEIGNVKDHLVEAGSTIVYVDRGSTWFEVIETLRRMSGEEARKLLAFPSPFEDPKPAICKNQFTDHLDGGRFYVCELLAGHGGEQHACGDVGWAVEPEAEAMLEALPSSAPAHPSSAELRERLIVDAEHNADWPEMARIASQAIDALEALENGRQDESDGSGGVHSVHDQDGLHHLRRSGEQAGTNEDSKAEPDDVGAAGSGHSESSGLLVGSGESDEGDERRKIGSREWEPLHARIMELVDEVAGLKTEKDAAYEERNRLVALFASMALALGWKAGVGQHEDELGKEWDADWRTLVMVETPEGQASWHFHDSHNHLVKHLPSYVAKWDGHDTPTKYARLERLMHAMARREPVFGPLVADYKRGKEAGMLEAAEQCKAQADACDELFSDRSDPNRYAGKSHLLGQQQAYRLMEESLKSMAASKYKDPGSVGMTRNPTAEEELARVRSELNHYREKYLNDDRIPLANAEIIRLGREVVQRDVEIERLRTISKADAAGTVKAVDYAEDAREEIEQLQNEVAAMRSSIQFCSGSCRLPEDTAPMVDGVRLSDPGHHARDEAEEIANEAMRVGWAECNRLRIRVAALNTGDIVHQDEKAHLAKKISVLEAKLVEATEFEKRTRHQLSEFTAACNRADAAEFALADVQTELEERQRFNKADYKRVHERYMSRRSDPHAHHDNGDVECGRAQESEHMYDFIRTRISHLQKLPTPERRAQEIAYLEEKYAINASVASRLQPKERNPWTLQYAEDHAEVEAEKIRYETEAIREIGGCGTIAGTKPYERACILPMGHPGPHGWQESAESSVVVRLEAAQGGFRAVVGSPHDAGFVMMAAIDIEDDARFYVDSANKALGPFLQAAYRRGLLKGAEECRVVAAEMDRRTSGSRNAANEEADVRYRAKRDAASECQMLIEALAKVAT